MQEYVLTFGSFSAEVWQYFTTRRECSLSAPFNQMLKFEVGFNFLFLFASWAGVDPNLMLLSWAGAFTDSNQTGS